MCLSSMTQEDRTVHHDSNFTFVGIDAHQESLSLALIRPGEVAPSEVQRIPNRPSRVRDFFRRLLERGPVRATYEAGCLGFVLHRQLTKLGVDCMVAAPNLIPVRPGDRRKTDRLDAQRLAIFLRGDQLTAVKPPTPELEALRALMRTRMSMRKDVVRARHRVQKFLVLRGKVYREGTNWTQRHWRWLRGLRLDLDDDQDTFHYLLAELEHRIDSLKMLDDRIERVSHREEYRVPVSALRAFKGVATTSAMAIFAEIGDPRRFTSGRQLGALAGLYPSERSSGERTRRGGLDRAGNPRLRRILVEAAQHYARPTGPGHARRTRRKEAPPRPHAGAAPAVHERQA